MTRRLRFPQDDKDGGLLAVMTSWAYVLREDADRRNIACIVI
jgi:hypothetical protein